MKDYLKQILENVENQVLARCSVREYLQARLLQCLQDGGVFHSWAFQRGTALRFLYSFPRFSEDLDFALEGPGAEDTFRTVLTKVKRLFESEDYSIRIKINDTKTVKSAFVRFPELPFELGLSPHTTEALSIKVEIDTNPPAGSKYERQFIMFPYAFSITTQDLPSMFASKCHALLCRPYTKGRDWFDFVWYVSKKIVPNYTHLTYAINQEGPWKKQNINTNKEWLLESLKIKIMKIDWDAARHDVENFLQIKDRETLNVWGVDFFLSLVKSFAKIK